MSGLILINVSMGCALAGAIKESIKEGRELALVDKLTGVKNRRYLEEYLEQCWRLLSRERRGAGERELELEKQVSIIICDVDYFKKYNDRYGHLAGDECLKWVASAIVEAAGRKGDVVARYGGEEFVVVLPNTDKEGAESVGRRIYSNIREMAIPHEEGIGSIVTLSIGVATGVPSTVTAKQLIDSADRAMYYAKHSGRNKIASVDNLLEL